MKKKMLAMLLAAAMLVSLAACGSSGDTAATDTAAETEETTETTETTDAADTADTAETEETADTATDASDLTIGVSFGQNVHPFFVAMQLGIEAACADYGIENVNILAADSSLEF